MAALPSSIVGETPSGSTTPDSSRMSLTLTNATKESTFDHALKHFLCSKAWV